MYVCSLFLNTGRNTFKCMYIHIYIGLLWIPAVQTRTCSSSKSHSPLLNWLDLGLIHITPKKRSQNSRVITNLDRFPIPEMNHHDPAMMRSCSKAALRTPWWSRRACFTGPKGTSQKHGCEEETWELPNKHGTETHDEENYLIIYFM